MRKEPIYIIRNFVGKWTALLTIKSIPTEAAPCSDQQDADFVEQMRAVPGAIALICVCDGNGRTGMAATAWNSLCADPPMLLACVNRSASAHPLITQGRRFSVSLLSTADVETVAVFSGQRGLSGDARFVEGAWSTGPGGQPLFAGAVAAFECELEAAHSYGTHDILIGKVRHTRKGPPAPPLIYLDGAFWEPKRLDPR